MNVVAQLAKKVVSITAHPLLARQGEGGGLGFPAPACHKLFCSIKVQGEKEGDGKGAGRCLQPT